MTGGLFSLGVDGVAYGTGTWVVGVAGGPESQLRFIPLQSRSPDMLNSLHGEDGDSESMKHIDDAQLLKENGNAISPGWPTCFGNPGKAGNVGRFFGGALFPSRPVGVGEGSGVEGVVGIGLAGVVVVVGVEGPEGVLGLLKSGS